MSDLEQPTPDPPVSLSLSSTLAPSFSHVTAVLEGQLLLYLQADMQKAQWTLFCYLQASVTVVPRLPTASFCLLLGLKARAGRTRSLHSPKGDWCTRLHTDTVGCVYLTRGTSKSCSTTTMAVGAK